MTRRWAIGAAVATVLAAGSGYGALATTAAGQPTTETVRICGLGTMGQDVQEGASNQDHPTASMFSGNEESDPTTQCTGDNSSAGSDAWTIDHSNVDVVTERGTEHGIWQRPSAPPAGFNGHITDYDHQSGGDPCMSAGRTVYYQSGTDTECVPSFGPVGNFNTHGGAATGQHFRGNYGTIIFQQGDATSTSKCQVGSQTYCIQIDLTGQTN